MNSREHWDTVYRQTPPDKLSWFQRQPAVSLALIARAAASRDAHILDVGGGASTLVDALLAAGFANVSVLDLAPSALDRVRERLGPRACRVTLLNADILTEAIPSSSVDVWHDRAVFHFLTRADERQRYLDQVQRAVRPGGHVIMATFAEDGPTRCSGLDVVRYSPAALHEMLGSGLALESSTFENHLTPGGSHQAFVYCLFRRGTGSSVP